ncbi:MAG TPA: zf-HC2 domain-containing protein [Candidatus Acidoferrum sp.]|nr:zf-HC2 domain-containing protein [Candidatus Acidoferrum sp.]
MKCEQIGELLPDFLQGSLNEEQNEIVELHMAQCADCRDEVAIWKKLGLLPEEQPSAASRARFEATLHAYQTGRSDRASARFGRAGRAAGSNIWQWVRTPLGAVAWSAALLVIGIFAGNYFGSRPTHSDTGQNEIAAMHTELTNMRQLVVLSMLQQQSASERLQGVSWSQQEEHLDPQVMVALLHTLRFDGSVDVRLAALNALSRHAGQPQVHKGVLDALQQQQSPLVQVALIDLLTEWRDPDAAQRLRNFEQTPNLNPTVKQRAEWAVSKLN